MSRRRGTKRAVVRVHLRTENQPYEHGTRTVWRTTRFYDLALECGHEVGRYASTTSPAHVYCLDCVRAA